MSNICSVFLVQHRSDRPSWPALERHYDVNLPFRFIFRSFVAMKKSMVAFFLAAATRSGVEWLFVHSADQAATEGEGAPGDMPIDGRGGLSYRFLQRAMR